jgi:hypothetical protein
VKDVDAAIWGFVRLVFHRDMDDPLGYDMVLNVGTLSAETAADAIVVAIRRKLGAI